MCFIQNLLSHIDIFEIPTWIRIIPTMRVILLGVEFNSICLHCSDDDNQVHPSTCFLRQHQKKLEEAPEGDIVFYCDVGRTFPYKLLSGSLQFFLDWMKAHEQSVMPGIKIPWGGPMSMWTKRDAFVSMSMDTPSVHATAPIQASFSIWINSPASRDIAKEWMNLSANRQMISDDPSKLGFPELPDFYEHRHDQSLMSLVCLKRHMEGMDVGCDMPPIDAKNPSNVTELLGGKTGDSTAEGRLVAGLASVVERLEWTARKWVKFNEPQARPDVCKN